MANEYEALEPAANILLLLESILEEGDTVKVREQDQASPPFQALMMTHANESITLSEKAVIDSNVLKLKSGHGLSVGNMLQVWWNGTHEQFEVLGVATNDITIDSPVSYPYPIVGTKLVGGSANMAVNGSIGSPIYFYLTPFNMSAPIDIDTIVVTIQSGVNVPDDGKFGGITKLTNGVYFRIFDGSRFNLGNYRDNQDFRNKGAKVEYTDAAPNGTNGTVIFFNLREVLGIVLRLKSSTEDRLLACVRDTLLSSGLAGMYVSFIGQITIGEN